MKVVEQMISNGAILMGLLLVVCLFLVGCTTIGKGRSTLVLASKQDASTYPGREFSHLFSEETKSPLRSLGAGKPFKNSHWENFLASRYGLDATSRSALAAPNSAEISVSVRDRSRTPIFNALNFDTANAEQITTLLLNNELDLEQKNRLLKGLRNNYAMRPEVDTRVVFDRYKRHTSEAEKNKGSETGLVGLYRYFIELELDFSGTLQSADPTTRFDYLAAAIRIPNDKDARFVNFSPKEADLFDLTIGNLKSTANLSASADSSATVENSSGQEDEEATGVKSTNARSRSATTEYGLSFDLNEELTREIKTSLDVRSAGIHDEGKMFVIELRGDTLKRISGTYSYQVMIEIQSKPDIEGGYGISKPKETDLTLQTRSVGVVRHLLKRGLTGRLNRVPEPLNDHTFNQVVISESVVDAWKSNGTPRGELLLGEQTPNNLVVLTGYPEANYLIRDKANNNAVLGYGSGKKSSFKLPTKTNFEIEFFPFVTSNEVVLEFDANEQSGTIPDTGASTVYGEYVLRKVINQEK